MSRSTTFRRICALLVLSAALLTALRPDYVAAGVIPPQAAPAEASAQASFNLSVPEASARAEDACRASRLMAGLTPSEKQMLAEDPSLFLSDGGSALGLVVVILAIIGITALILNATGHRVSVEAGAGG